MLASLLFALYIARRTITAAASIDDFIYYNSGTTTKYDEYELIPVDAIYNEGYQYKDDVFGSNEWSVGSPLTYLFQRHQNGSLGTPSSGMRSSVFLGPVGQGGFELRGDGRMTDFTIFNNAPNARPSPFAKKWDLNDAVFGFSFASENGQNATSKIFQTSPMDVEMVPYSMERLTYSGAYPSSRLVAEDTDLRRSLGIGNITLTAFSAFEPLNVNMSSIPSVVFWFDIDNRQNSKNIDFRFWLNWPDIIDATSVYSKNDGFMLDKAFDAADAEYFTAGNLTWSVQQCNRANSTCTSTDITGRVTSAQSLYENWQSFLGLNHTSSSSSHSSQSGTAPKMYAHYAWNGDSIRVSAHSTYSFAAVVSWYYPHRTFNDNQQYLGHFYNNFGFASSDDVNRDMLLKLPLVINNIAAWHRLWSNAMPAMYAGFLKDIYVNAPSFVSRTGFMLESDVDGTGIWRQSESFSCFQVDPPHIHQYRSLAYQLLFGAALERGTLSMYAANEVDGGLVSENFGGSCGGISGEMGRANGQARGDDNSLFVLAMYAQFKWYTDGRDTFVAQKYASVKTAMQWVLQQSVPPGYGLPYRLVDTFDEHGMMGDINTYNAMIYVSALYAMKRMASFYEADNATYHSELQDAVGFAVGNLTQRLFQSDGGFFISLWCENGEYSEYGLQSDVLYGYLWSLLLGLDADWDADMRQRIASHLQMEFARNWSPFGLQFMTNRTTDDFHCGESRKDDEDAEFLSMGNLGVGFVDTDTWEMATIDHAAISLFTRNAEALNDSVFTVLETGLNKYRLLFRDQWDWRDTSSTYDDYDPEYSRPVVNSHYARQLIHFAVMLALNGQHMDVSVTATGSSQLQVNLEPMVAFDDGENGCLPVMMPQCIFLLCLNTDSKCFELDVLFTYQDMNSSGQQLIVIDELSVVNERVAYTFNAVNITKGRVTELCF